MCAAQSEIFKLYCIICITIEIDQAWTMINWHLDLYLLGIGLQLHLHPKSLHKL